MNLSGVSRILLFLGSTPLFPASSATAAESTVAAPIGSFDVVRVLVDENNNLHNSFKSDDPQLVNRIVKFTEQGITLNNGYRPCERPKISVTRAMPKRLLKEVMSRREFDGTMEAPTTSELGLPLSPGKPVNVFHFACQGGQDNIWYKSLAIQLAGSGWAVFYKRESWLLLSPRKPKQPPRPSFDCARATTDAERTICGDPGLAGWDRSVQAAYRRSLKSTHTSSLDEVTVERNKCGKDMGCIQRAMESYIMNTMYGSP